MTSLIFWGPYLAHKSVISRKREKQRVKNYDRWEGLRDDYDEQRKIARESRSLDIQRTGTWDPSTPQYSSTSTYDDHDRGIFTLRDQQEANDARTSWRPQEAWESPRTQVQAQMTGQVQHYQTQRHVSSTPAIPTQTTNGMSRSSLQPQKTGAIWDEGLPAPLQVSRRSFDDEDYSHRYRPGSISSSANVSRQPSQTRRESGISRTHTPSALRETTQISPPQQEIIAIVEQPKNEFGFVDPTYVRPVSTAMAGGRMAELIERGY